MTISIGVGGAYKTVAAMWVGVGGVWKAVPKIEIGVGGAWKVAYSALDVTASTVSDTDSGMAASGTVNSAGEDSPETTVTGGSGNYSYLWEHVSTSSGNTPTISSASAQNPSWSATVTDGVESQSVWKVTVTDTSYGVTDETQISVILVWVDLR